MEVLNSITDRLAWIELWQKWDGKEVFAHPDYINLYTNVDSQAFCAVMKTEKATIIYPFIRRSLFCEEYCSEELYDLTTAYGYGDIFVWGDWDRILIQQFYVDFCNWASKNNIVCEFIRFALDSVTRDYYKGNILLNNQNVVVDLTLTPEQMWNNFKHKVRKNVNRAKNCNLEVVFDNTGEKIDEFLRIYDATMKRRNAEEKYYFSKDFFDSIIRNLNGQFVFCHVLYQGIVISTELILISDKNIYSFLGGTLDGYSEMRPNDLLKFEVINWGREHNKKKYVLGGGYIPMDGIFQYKQAFSPEGVIPFYIGKQVFNQQEYNKLISNKKRIEPQWLSDENYFPEYRYK
ncbi:GNAT family N-acetyltransferase [Phocaeicola sp.]